MMEYEMTEKEKEIEQKIDTLDSEIDEVYESFKLHQKKSLQWIGVTILFVIVGFLPIIPKIGLLFVNIGMIASLFIHIKENDIAQLEKGKLKGIAIAMKVFVKEN